MRTHSHIQCPVCHGALIPVKLQCDTCHIAVTGRFASNEFATLNQDDLHLLRIFVLCEGRIREMESALGVSYPTIKARMAQLKATLAAGRAAAEGVVWVADAPAAIGARESAASRVLKELEAGRINYTQAMEQLQSLPKETS